MTSKRRRTSCLRNILEKDNRLYICEICRCEDMELDDGQWLWNGKPLKLEIDHIQRYQHTDDDLDHPSNLRWLCPNCHKSTPSWANNGKKRLHFQEKSDKRRQMEKHGKEYICTECQCVHMQKEHHYWLWKDWPLNLEQDHIHGRNIENPHSADNMRWLCRNCHSQTSNFCGHGKRKKIKRTVS